MRILFDTFSPIIHTKTPENADENGDFRKQLLKWARLKTHRFEDALFLVWTVENGDFWKRWCRKRQKRSVPVQLGASIQDGGWLTHAQSQVPVVSSFSSVFRVWTGENDTNILLRFRRDENGHFWKRISVDGALAPVDQYRIDRDGLFLAFIYENFLLARPHLNGHTLGFHPQTQ